MVFKKGDVIVLTGKLWQSVEAPKRGEAYVIDKIYGTAGQFRDSLGESWYGYEEEGDPWGAKPIVNEDGTIGWNADDFETVMGSLEQLVERSQLTRKAFEEMAEAIQRSLGKGVRNMARLPRDRKGKTPIDVGVVTQDGLTRVRVSMGEDGTPGRKNSDLSYKETEDLITMLTYNLAVAKGEITIT